MESWLVAGIQKESLSSALPGPIMSTALALGDVLREDYFKIDKSFENAVEEPFRNGKFEYLRGDRTSRKRSEAIWFTTNSKLSKSATDEPLVWNTYCTVV